MSDVGSESAAPTPERLRVAFLAPLPLIAAFAFYSPITGNYFFGDDLLNLYYIVDWGFWRYVLDPFAGHVLVLRNAIFYACFQLFGPEPRYFFVLVLLTHLLNVFLLYRVVELFTGSRRLACFGAVLWGISPTNEGTIGWYSVYGQTLVGTGALWVLSRFARISGGALVSNRELVVWGLLIVAMSTLFGTGTGVAMTVPIVALLVFPPSAMRRRALRALIAAGVSVPVLYYALHVLADQHGWAATGRSPTEVAHHVPTAIGLFLELLGRGIESLFLGEVDVAVTEAPALVVVVAFALLLAAAAYAGDAAQRRLLVASLGLASAGYFMVALGRGAMVARGLRIELVLSATRYHYLGPLFFALALCIALAIVGRRLRLRGVGCDALLVVAVLIAVGARTFNDGEIDAHRSARRHTEDAVRRLGGALGAAPPDSDVYLRLPEVPFQGVGPLLIRSPNVFPSWAGVFVVFFPDDAIDGRRVFFVTEDRRILDSKPGGRRSSSLFVTPEDVPHGRSIVDF